MIDYRDFMQTAFADIHRADKLFNEGDFGFAAYCAQQGLEKYLKAYLLKCNLIGDVQILGHLQYHQIMSEVVKELERQKKLEKSNSAFYKMLDATAKFFLDLKEIFEIIKEPTKKILVWKSSLGIELNKNEQRIDKGLGLKLEKIKQEYLLSFQNLLIPALSDINVDRLASIDPANIQKFLSIFQKALQEVVNPTQSMEQNFQLLDEMILFAKPFFYGSGPNSLSKTDTDFISKLYLLIRTWLWIETVIESFPHEEIGRYPTDINGMNSELLYKEKKENLLRLIQKIRTACDQIKNDIG